MSPKTIKILFVIYLFQMEKINGSRQLEISCNNYLPWRFGDGLSSNYWHGIPEAGQVCQFNIDTSNPQEHWIMRNFSCGTNSKRIVMCEKAFELFKLVCKLDTICARATFECIQKS